MLNPPIKKGRSELGDIHQIGTAARSFDPQPRSIPGLKKKAR